MSIGCFNNKLVQPSPEDVEMALGPAFGLWQRLVRFIDEQYQMTGELSYGGKNYGWNLWYRKSGKSLVSLFPQDGSFVAQVVLGREQVEKAMALSLSPNVGTLLRETPQLHDGKWLFIPVTTEADVDDVEQLLLLKKRPVRRKPENP